MAPDDQAFGHCQARASGRSSTGFVKRTNGRGRVTRGAVRLLAAALLASAPAAPLPAQTRAEIDALARDVDRVEAIRAIKDLQRLYAQYVQLGQWQAAADLFSESGRLVRGTDAVQGRGAIRDWLKARGGGQDGLPPGALHTELIDEPLLSMSADGRTIQSRWMSLSLTGDGKGAARLESGVYENDYVRENGVWKIALAHYHPQFEGDYATGWTNIGGADLPIVPYHITPEQTGRPIPPAAGAPPRSGETLAGLERRIAALNDEDAVRNLQHSYGYYVDRRMWDDVVDLFAEGGVVEIAGEGRHEGKDGIRRALERMGPAGLSAGELNDRPLFGTLVEVMPGGTEAYSRGIELGMLGSQSRDMAGWSITIFRNRFVKEDGIWKLRELRLFPLMAADYARGWGDGGTLRPAALPAFLSPHPVTGKAVSLPGAAAASGPLTGAAPAPQALPAGPGSARYADAKRRLSRSLAFDAAENVSSAYGFYIDDFMWDEMGAIFAEKGNKQSPFAGYYLGRDRIMGAVNATWGPTPQTRPGISYHWRTQPVILVSQDGRSANLRTRLFQPRTGKEVNGGFYGAVFSNGMYPNDQLVLEGDVWRLWSLTIDEPYFSMKTWKDGWNGVKAGPPGRRPPPSALIAKYPPDILLTELGEREAGFRGGTGETIEWPGILPMWFNYRNLVSGRTPERYWPDCVPCGMLPAARMTSHGYQMPPTGPSVDGVEVK
nr:nuclear transport factor 2 family protein [Sphingobium lignivorans]